MGGREGVEEEGWAGWRVYDIKAGPAAAGGHVSPRAIKREHKRHHPPPQTTAATWLDG